MPPPGAGVAAPPIRRREGRAACRGGIGGGPPLFLPPYLFDSKDAFIEQSGERPVIDEAQTPDVISYGSLFEVWLDTAHPHDVGGEWKLSLVRLGAATHSFDQNQRFLWLSFIAQPELDRFRVAAPPQGNVAPPGYYMLFVLRPGDREGILFPSRAKIVKLQ